MAIEGSLHDQVPESPPCYAYTITHCLHSWLQVARNIELKQNKAQRNRQLQQQLLREKLRAAAEHVAEVVNKREEKIQELSKTTQERLALAQQVLKPQYQQTTTRTTQP